MFDIQLIACSLKVPLWLEGFTIEVVLTALCTALSLCRVDDNVINYVVFK